jgi:hypothetical protein
LPAETLFILLRVAELVDGLFCTIPSESVRPELRDAINSGVEEVEVDSSKAV